MASRNTSSDGVPEQVRRFSVEVREFEESGIRVAVEFNTTQRWDQHVPVTGYRVEFVFRLPRAGTRDSLHAALCSVPDDVRGEIDWEVE